MRRLFFKIFLSFLLAVLLWFIIGMVIAISFDSGEGPGRLGRMPGGPFADHALLIERLLAKHGRDVAVDYLDALSETGAFQAYLLDGDGSEIRGTTPPQAIQHFAARVRQGEGTRRDHADGHWLSAVRLSVAGQKPYVFVLETRRPGPPWGRVPWPLAPLVAVMGIVCYFLARYLTRPILALRAATRRFAGGDLEHRVGPTIGNRRDELGELARF